MYIPGEAGGGRERERGDSSGRSTQVVVRGEGGNNRHAPAQGICQTLLVSYLLSPRSDARKPFMI